MFQLYCLAIDPFVEINVPRRSSRTRCTAPDSPHLCPWTPMFHTRFRRKSKKHYEIYFSIMRSGAQNRSQSNPLYKKWLKYCKNPKIGMCQKCVFRCFFCIHRSPRVITTDDAAQPPIRPELIGQPGSVEQEVLNRYSAKNSKQIREIRI